eukprot:TRINITY_DN483_c3_g1_i1.p1 TRINITY_DN483_c3_g1~~TRINITY_DN483_c3_g1_i1.p1  ORF type:complete len:447 (-),score=88.84 TRINITY_DN483_c3_g1_i1:675-2015(-)
MMKNLLLLKLNIIFLFFVFEVSFIFCSSNDQLTFFQLSDVHLNPYYDGNAPASGYCKQSNVKSYEANLDSNYPFGKYNCDTPFILLNNTLQQMKDINPNPTMIVLNGDYVGHAMPSKNVSWEVIQVASNTINTYFPNTLVIPALGNNDFTSDYHYPLDTNTEWLNNLSFFWKSLNWLTDDQQNTFIYGGYYSTDIPNFPYRIITLNTLLYSQSYVATNDTSVTKPTNPDDLPEDPYDQFQWLKTELEDSKQQNKKAILSYHIPPGIDAYSALSYYYDKYQSQFESIVKEYKDTIYLQFGAHSHADEYMIMWDDNNSPISSILLNPSLSPVFDNNPSFRYYTGDSDSIETYSEYYIDLPRSNLQKIAEYEVEYDLLNAYNIYPITTSSMYKLFSILTHETLVYDEYAMRKYVSKAPSRANLLCQIACQDFDNFENCIEYIDDDNLLV